MFVGIGVGVGRQRFAGGFADSYSSRVLADGGTIEALSCVANASTLLQQASLLFIPSGYKASVAYSALPNNGNGDLTWSRNSTANRTNSSGLIESVGANVPRLSYMYGSCPSALLEPQRTNLLLRSQEFDNASWSNNGRIISANIATAPDGTQTADLIYPSSTGVFRGTFQAGFPINSYNFSVFAKASGKNFMFFYVVGASASNGVWFDLSNGTIGTIGSSWTNVQIQNFGNGWYRCSANVTLTTSPSNNLYYLISDTNGSNSVTTSGTDGILLWGAQLEVGAYATTYIPTTTATATRLADIFTRNNIYTNGLIGASGGTWYVELNNNIGYIRDSTNGFGITDTTNFSQNGLFFRQNASIAERWALQKLIGGVRTSVYVTTSDNVKLAIKWDGSTLNVFANGVRVVSASAFTTTIMEFLQTGSAVGIPTFIQAMALYNEPKSDQFCIDLTT